VRTLVVGGDYVLREGARFVPERCWRMVRIFSDALADPVFARRRVESDDGRLYSTRFPDGLELRASCSGPGRPPWQVAFPDLPWNAAHHRRLVEDVDAVYCRVPPLWSHLHLFDAARAQGKVVFASIHGDWPGVYRHLARQSPFPRSLLYARLAHRVDAALHRMAASARVLFCVGRRLAETYGARARATVTFANYLHRDADVAEREDTCASPPYRVLFVGNLEPRKGVVHLLRAAATLRNRALPVEVSFVGSGEEREPLAREAQRLGLADAVRFHGYVPFGPELLARYREADLFALPASVGEGLPKVIVEAMSQGLPVVATDVGSTRDVLDASGAGRLVPPDDPAALADALSALAADPEERRRRIRGGLAYARAHTYEAQRAHVAAALREHVPELVRDA